MARYSGMIGFLASYEKPDQKGVWVDGIVERQYYGDIVRNQRQYALGEGTIDNIQLQNAFSIIADPYLHENFMHIVYVTYMGTKWKVTNADVRRPRIILTVNGEYK